MANDSIFIEGSDDPSKQSSGSALAIVLTSTTIFRLNCAVALSGCAFTAKRVIIIVADMNTYCLGNNQSLLLI